MEDGGLRGELELADYLAIVRRRWGWFTTPLLVGLGLALLLSIRNPDQYSATAEVLLGETAAQEAVGGSNQNTLYRNRVLENELSLAKSDAAYEAVADRFGVGPGDVPEASIRADDASDVLVFTATSTEPQTSADTANAWAETYVELKQTQALASITGAVSQLQARLLTLQEQRDEIRAALSDLEDDLVQASDEDKAQAQLLVDREESRISGQVALIDAQIAAVVDSINELELSGELALSGSARVISRANVPVDSTNPPPSRNVVLGVVLGAMIGAGLALLRENLDRAVRTEEHIEVLGAIHLGSVPKVKGDWTDHALASAKHPEGAQAEAYQKIQAAVQFVAATENIRSIAVTSPRQGDGKTTTATNLATAMARAGRYTLLADADLRRPRLHKVYEVPQSPGLANVVLDNDLLHRAARPLGDTPQFLAGLTAGMLPPHPAGFIGGEAFEATVGVLEEAADLVIFDAAPVLPVADTLALASRVDGLLVVANAGSTTRDDLLETIESLTAAGGNVIGCVLVGAKDTRDAYRYRYDESEKLDRMTAVPLPALATPRAASPEPSTPSQVPTPPTAEPQRSTNGGHPQPTNGRRVEQEPIVVDAPPAS